MGKHRKQIVITTMALLLAIVGYITYDTRFMSAANEEDMGTESILDAGQVVLTNAEPDNVNYAAAVKLEREQIRAQSRETLQQIIDNEQLSETEKQAAVEEMAVLTKRAQMESDAQMLLEAKGFISPVVSISDDCCDVILDDSDVSDEKRAQVEDIIKRKTDINVENIVITSISEDFD